MILYHGTDSKNLDSILTRGLLSRKFTGNQVYGGEFVSNENFTYLTRWNPVAHAYSIDENSPLILKVDVDENDLYPDEDFIERLHFMVTGKSGNTSDFDITEYKDKWKLSYDKFGNVAIREVPPEKIISHIVLDPSDFDYHCGLGAQGNQLIPDIKNELHFMRGDSVKKYIKRLDLLFGKGWDAVKRDILKDRPSLVFTIPKPTEHIRVRGRRLRVIFKPISPHFVYICDEWQENFPIKFPTVDKNFSKLVQVPGECVIERGNG
jgi:hypothetical protein